MVLYLGTSFEVLVNIKINNLHKNFNFTEKGRQRYWFIIYDYFAICNQHARQWLIKF